MLRTILTTLLALLLIIIGIWILWLAVTRIWPGPGPVATPTPAVSGPSSAPVDDPTLTVGPAAQLTSTSSSLLTSLENGGMALGTICSTTTVDNNGVVTTQTICVDGESTGTEKKTTDAADAPGVTPDPCPPQLASGFAADANVTAIGMLSLYGEPDLESGALGEFSAGQNFLVTSDANGVTAVRRCELVWVRVRLTGGMWGWALASAIQLGPIIITPIVITPVFPPTLPPICPGGCGTPTCVTPCYDPCTQPCNDPCYSPCGGGYTPPCTTPCGVYSQ